MGSINVCFSTSSGFFSKVIRWATRSKVSHALITFRDETLDKVFVMEANGRGFMLVPWSKWRQSHDLLSRYKLTVPADMQRFALQDIAQSLGAQYDYVSILGFFFRRWFRRMRNPLDDPGKLICSEAVAKFLATSGLKRFENHGTWTPEDLLEEAKKGGEFVLEEDGSGQS